MKFNVKIDLDAEIMADYGVLVGFWNYVYAADNVKIGKL